MSGRLKRLASTNALRKIKGHILIEDEHQPKADLLSVKRKDIKIENADSIASNETEVAIRKRLKTEKSPKTKTFIRYPKPENWESVYSLIEKMRIDRNAPVDTMGCERQGDKEEAPNVYRFQTLVALMLSSQTKDAITSEAMGKLRNHKPDGLTVDSVRAMSAEKLNSYIAKVGFHRNKTKYIKQVCEILRDKYNSDIPDTLDGLLALPGVGPKMAHLCMQCAWGETVGIGVDVHVHRIANRLGWAHSKTPEETRLCLESWLPKDKWRQINVLLVGFGQTICQPVKPKCSSCLLSKGLCPSSLVSDI